MLKLTTDAIAGEAPEITQSLDELARERARRMILAARGVFGDRVCSWMAGKK